VEGKRGSNLHPFPTPEDQNWEDREWVQQEGEIRDLAARAGTPHGCDSLLEVEWVWKYFPFWN